MVEEMKTFWRIFLVAFFTHFLLQVSLEDEGADPSQQENKEKPKNGENNGDSKPKEGADPSQQENKEKPKNGENNGDSKPKEGADPSQQENKEKPKNGENNGDSKPKDKSGEDASQPKADPKDPSKENKKKTQEFDPIRPDDLATFEGIDTRKKEVQVEILKITNQCRSEVNPPAARMQKVEWSNDLMKIAQAWVDKCHMNHSQPQQRICNGTVPGENVLVASVPVTWTKTIFVWNSEKNSFTFGVNCSENCECGHYTQLVTQDTYLCGCAVARCKDGQAYYACLYLHAGNEKSSLYKPYTKGESCSGCKNHRDPNGKLCINPCPEQDEYRGCGDRMKKKRNLCSGSDQSKCKASCHCYK